MPRKCFKIKKGVGRVGIKRERDFTAGRTIRPFLLLLLLFNFRVNGHKIPDAVTSTVRIKPH